MDKLVKLRMKQPKPVMRQMAAAVLQLTLQGYEVTILTFKQKN